MTDRRLKVKAAPPPNGDPLEFIMSDDSVDRMGDIIEVDGWLLDNFRKNPIALFGHNPSFPIGKWSEVGVRGNQLIGRLQLMDPVSDRMREVHAAVDAGVLRAVSVGFHPTPGKYEPIEGSKVGGLRFSEQELVECSLVSVPANPNALALAKALGISPQGQRLIFGVPADGDQELRRRGFHGVSASQVPRKPQAMNQLSDRIQTAQAELVGLQDQLTATEDLTQTADLTQRIEEIKDQISIYSRAERALGSESEAITVPASRTTVLPPGSTLPAAGPKTWAMPKKQEEPGYLFIRHCVVRALAHITKKPEDQILAEHYGDRGDFEVTKTVHDWYKRAATAPATTTTTGWAAELAQIQYGEFFDILMPEGIYRPLAAKGFRATLGRYATLSMPTRSATPTVAGSFVGEGAPIPVRQAAFLPVTIGLKKMAIICSYTRELAEHSTPQIEGLLRKLISEDTEVAVDTTLIDNVASSAIRPAGLRNGVSGLTATAGGGFAALLGDIKQLVGVLSAANALRVPVWIMNPQQAISISLTINSGGFFPFKAEIDSGMLQGYPVITSNTVPLGTVIILNADDFMSVTGDDPRFDVSDQATLHFEDTTPLQIGTAGSPPTVAAPVRSLFQTDSLALRMILPMNWAMRRTGVVAWLSSVTW
jgi:HK97 family phage major capsid protein/HK97 family phage prohead protease